jgi:hypothetical protein
MYMVETNTYEEHLLRCNNCSDELCMDERNDGEQRCAWCKCGFSSSDDIECLERDDSNLHYHKKCFAVDRVPKPKPEPFCECGHKMSDDGKHMIRLMGFPNSCRAPNKDGSICDCDKPRKVIK